MINVHFRTHGMAKPKFTRVDTNTVPIFKLDVAFLYFKYEQYIKLVNKKNDDW